MTFTSPRSSASRSAVYSAVGSCQNTTRWEASRLCSASWTEVRSVTRCLQSRNLLKRSTELRVVHLHAIVEVDVDVLRRFREERVVLVLVQLNKNLSARIACLAAPTMLS